MPEEKGYYVRRYCTGTQVYFVRATSKSDARRKVLAGEAEPVDFTITGAETTTMSIEEAE